MALTKEWLNRNYIEPLERVSYKLDSQKNRGYLSSSNNSENKCKCNWKICFCILLIIILIIVFANVNES